MSQTFSSNDSLISQGDDDRAQQPNAAHSDAADQSDAAQPVEGMDAADQSGAAQQEMQPEQEAEAAQLLVSSVPIDSKSWFSNAYVKTWDQKCETNVKLCSSCVSIFVSLYLYML